MLKISEPSRSTPPRRPPPPGGAKANACSLRTRLPARRRRSPSPSPSGKEVPEGRIRGADPPRSTGRYPARSRWMGAGGAWRVAGPRSDGGDRHQPPATSFRPDPTASVRQLASSAPGVYGSRPRVRPARPGRPAIGTGGRRRPGRTVAGDAGGPRSPGGGTPPRADGPARAARLPPPGPSRGARGTGPAGRRMSGRVENEKPRPSRPHLIRQVAGSRCHPARKPDNGHRVDPSR